MMSGARIVIIGRYGQLSRSLSDVLKAAKMVGASVPPERFWEA